VPQAVSHGSQLANRPVQFFGLCGEHLSVDPRPAIRREHARDLIEAEAGRASERDEREAVQNTGVE